MKINTSRSRAKKGMKSSGNTKNRPEQLLAAVLIKMHLPQWCSTETEVDVSLFDADNPDVPYERTIDIVVKNMKEKFAIEMQGPPHDELPQIRKDRRRGIILEWKGNDYKFIEFHYEKMTNLWKKAYEDVTIDEAMAAYEEVKAALAEYLPMAECRRNNIETYLRKTQ